MEESNSITWIRVNIGEGMFSTENAVYLDLYNGKTVSFFADKELLREDRGRWLLKVRTIKRNHNSQLVLLPIETFETSTRWAEVPL